MPFPRPAFLAVLCAIAALHPLVNGFADPSCNVLDLDPNSKLMNPDLRSGLGPFLYGNVPTGPANWGRINCPGYYKCGAGRFQSPINVKSVKTWTPSCRLNLRLYHDNQVNLQYRYAANDFIFRCTSPYPVDCGRLSYRETYYNFLQAHIHSPSEHQIDGKTFDGEIHLVHQNELDLSLAVLGVFVQVNDTAGPNSEFGKLMDAAWTRTNATINMRDLIGEKIAVDPKPCTLLGSLTTPPCSEDVQWLLSTKHMTISRAQLDNFRRMVGGPNNRPVQSMIGRSVRCFIADPEPWLPNCTRDSY